MVIEKNQRKHMHFLLILGKFYFNTMNEKWPEEVRSGHANKCIRRIVLSFLLCVSILYWFGDYVGVLCVSVSMVRVGVEYDPCLFFM